jgi:hypothetical protein
MAVKTILTLDRNAPIGRMNLTPNWVSANKMREEPVPGGGCPNNISSGDMRRQDRSPRQIPDSTTVAIARPNTIIAVTIIGRKSRVLNIDRFLKTDNAQKCRRVRHWDPVGSVQGPRFTPIFDWTSH